jgi:hypothetical protein
VIRKHHLAASQRSDLDIACYYEPGYAPPSTHRLLVHAIALLNAFQYHIWQLNVPLDVLAPLHRHELCPRLPSCFITAFGAGWNSNQGLDFEAEPDSEDLSSVDLLRPESISVLPANFGSGSMIHPIRLLERIVGDTWSPSNEDAEDVLASDVAPRRRD